MTIIDVASTRQVYQVARHMRERDFTEFRALASTDDRTELARVLAKRYADREDVLCAALGGEPVCIGGVIEFWPGVVTLVFFATDAFPKVALTVTRFIRQQLFPRLEQAGVHRIQAIALAAHDDTHGWLRTLGLSQETGPMHGYGKRGEAFIQFARVAHVQDHG